MECFCCTTKPCGLKKGMLMSVVRETVWPLCSQGRDFSTCLMTPQRNTCKPSELLMYQGWHFFNLSTEQRNGEKTTLRTQETLRNPKKPRETCHTVKELFALMWGPACPFPGFPTLVIAAQSDWPTSAYYLLSLLFTNHTNDLGKGNNKQKKTGISQFLEFSDLWFTYVAMCHTCNMSYI